MKKMQYCRLQLYWSWFN